MSNTKDDERPTVGEAVDAIKTGRKARLVIGTSLAALLVLVAASERAQKSGN